MAISLDSTGRPPGAWHGRRQGSYVASHKLMAATSANRFCKP